MAKSKRTPKAAKPKTKPTPQASTTPVDEGPRIEATKPAKDNSPGSPSPVIDLPSWLPSWEECVSKIEQAGQDEEYNVKAETIEGKLLVDAFADPDRRKTADAAVARVLGIARQYDAESKKRLAFSPEWLQSHIIPAFLHKLQRPADVELYDTSDRIDLARFRDEILPRIFTMRSEADASFSSWPGIWKAERKQYITGHPYGYVLMHRVDPPGDDRDLHLALLAVLQDGGTGAPKVVARPTRTIHEIFYRALEHYCRALAGRSPLAFHAYLSELGRRKETEVEGEWSRPMPKEAIVTALGLPSVEKLTVLAEAGTYTLREAGNRQTWQILLKGIPQERRQNLV